MTINKWTLGLAAVGLVSLPSLTKADETETHPLGTALASTTIGGYVNASAHWNLGTGNEHTPIYSFGPGKADGFNLDAVNLTLQKPLDEAAWAAGYMIDLLFGPDANALGTTSVVGGNTSDLAIKQAYVALRAPVCNGLDFKVGVFDTVIGYEVTHAGNNPNYTRSYGYSLEPTTHTGVLLTYQFCEWFGASAGIANTFGPTINQRAFGNVGANNKAESYKTYMGAVAMTAPEDWGWIGGSTLYGGIVNGFNNNAPGSGGSGGVQTSYYLGATMNTPVEAVKVGAAFDYLQVSHQRFGAMVVPKGYAWAAGGYVSVQATDKLSLHGRGEFLNQTESWAGPGLPDKVLAATATVQYDLWDNVLSRVEFRWDHAAGEVGSAYGGSDPGDPPGLRNAFLLALNVIYKF
jgi:hypothetical protein